MKRLKLLLLLSLFTGQLPAAQYDKTHISTSQHRDSITLHFRRNSSFLESDYLQNEQALEYLSQIVDGSSKTDSIDKISICAFSSPDGAEAYNQNLASERATAIEGYIDYHFPQLRNTQVFSNSSINIWGKLTPYIEADSFTPHQQQVLEILAQSATTPPMTTQRLLKSVGDGAAWRYIANKYINYLICSDVTLKISTIQTTQVEQAKPTEQVVIISEPEPVIETQTIEFTPTITPTITPLFAIKTNLLYDILTIINIELEVPIGNRWSINGEWIFPWWVWDNGKPDSARNRIELLNGNIEGRYWFGNRSDHNVLTGWFASIYAGAGLYDFERNAHGYQGEALYSLGVSGGYAHTINRCGNLRLEYALSAGYMHTKYREYNAHYCIDDRWRAIRERNGKFSWVGPTELKVSLVWLLNYRNQRGGVR